MQNLEASLILAYTFSPYLWALQAGTHKLHTVFLAEKISLHKHICYMHKKVKQCISYAYALGSILIFANSWFNNPGATITILISHGLKV